MSTDDLFRAAALMRRRAEGCEPSLPWELSGDNIMALPMLTMRNPTQDRVRYTPSGGWRRAEIAGPSDEVTEHLASWNPFVALSVAHLLETVARLYDDDLGGLQAEALAVARGYLADPSP